MKLNPPASSSDLETARQIARRLHQSRRRDDRAASTWPSEEAPARPRLSPPPLPSRPAAAELPAFETRVKARVEAPVRPALPDVSIEADSDDPSFDLPEAPPFERPSWSEPATPEPEPAPLEDLAGAAEPTLFAPEEPAFEPQAAMPDVEVDVDQSPLSPEEMIGETEGDVSPLDQLTEPDASPFGEDLLDAPPVAEEPAPPSWDDVVATCRGLAQATGAMLIDPAGQVFAAGGTWPRPPDAIATKLVPMMEKMLKGAPTRSISAPMDGMHLTAWRVQLNEGLVTVAFIGAALVGADVRPTIDAEIHRGTGA